MVRESLLENIRVTGWTLVALTTSAALVAMFVTMSFDLERKMTRTLRKLGPNAVASPHFLSAEREGNLDLWKEFEDLVNRENMAAAKLSLEVVTVRGKPIVLAMSDPGELARMTPYWFVSGDRARAGSECLVGKRVARLLTLEPGMSIGVHSTSDSNEVTHYTITGIIVSGDEHEDRIFVPQLPSPSLKPRLTYALLSVPGGEEGIERLNAALHKAQSAIEIKPLREILHGEKSTLEKMDLLSSIALLAVLVLTVLGVSSALLSRVVERRKEFALLQAIGATKRSLIGFLLLEGVVMGAAASIGGFILGTLISEIMVRQIFHVSVTPQVIAFPITCMIILGVTLLTSSAGVIRALKIEPALALRGE